MLEDSRDLTHAIADEVTVLKGTGQGLGRKQGREGAEKESDAGLVCELHLNQGDLRSGQRELLAALEPRRGAGARELQREL